MAKYPGWILCAVLVFGGAACTQAADATSATASAAIDPPPLMQMLVDDDRWNAALAQQVAAEPAEGPDHVTWLETTMAFAFYARSFARGERNARALIALAPGDWQHHDDLSWVLGKEGHYQEALDEATKAGGLPGADQMHVAAISASWLWHLGRHDEANARFAAIVVPAQNTEAWAMYQCCRACFAASRHDLPVLQETVRTVMALGGGNVLFLKRDVIFDQYRDQAWFRALVGDTLAPPGKNAL